MDTVKFLEQLAQNAHYRIELDELINDQPNEIKEAFRTNNPEMLKKQLGDVEYLANPSDVVQA